MVEYPDGDFETMPDGHSGLANDQLCWSNLFVQFACFVGPLVKWYPKNSSVKSGSVAAGLPKKAYHMYISTQTFIFHKCLSQNTWIRAGFDKNFEKKSITKPVQLLAVALKKELHLSTAKRIARQPAAKLAADCTILNGNGLLAESASNPFPVKIVYSLISLSS